MTFESLAIAGLSIGLSMTDILDMRIGLIIGLINEKSNQVYDYNKSLKKNTNDGGEEEVIQGTAEMLMNM